MNKKKRENTGFRRVFQKKNGIPSRLGFWKMHRSDSVGRFGGSYWSRREETWMKTYLCVDWRHDLCAGGKGGPRDGWGGAWPGVRPRKTSTLTLGRPWFSVSFGQNLEGSDISTAGRREERRTKTYACVDWRQDTYRPGRGGPGEGWGGGRPGVRPPKNDQFWGKDQYWPRKKGPFWPTFSSPARARRALDPGPYLCYTCGPPTLCVS